MVATAVVGTALVGAYGADRAASSAESTAKRGIESEAQSAAANRELSMQRFAEAKRYLDPYQREAAQANYLMGQELTGRDYVPGRDDIQPLERATAEDFMQDVSQYAPGGEAYRGPTDYIDPTQHFEDISAGYSAFIDNPIYQQMIDQGSQTALSSAASQGMARSGTALSALRDVGQGVSSQFFGNYLNELGNVQGINEARRVSGENIEEQRYANYLNMAEGRDIRQQNVEEQRYSNYMNLLQNRASPAVATNIAALGMGQAADLGSAQSQSVAAQNQMAMGATAAQNAAYADLAGGVGNLASAYIGSGGFGGGGANINQTLANTTGTITPLY